MKNDNLALTILIYIMLVIMMITAYSLWRLKERVEEIEQRQYEVNEYILNRIGG
ncbi:MAG: hypothetical protein J6S67_10655 [Methanobrevibacter sp.]|nr:hypothetical protein [Methanobrevibacter sp.]